MNIVFMGTPDFAVEALSKIYDAGHNVLAVVSQVDRPSGRGMKLKPTPVKEYALSKGLTVYQVEKVRKNKEFIEKIKELRPDVIVVVAYGQILPQEFLDIPKYGSINVHGSLLPKYRGAAPIQWSVINGDKYTGITTMYMDAGMDTGDIIQKESIKIEEDDNYGSVYEKMKKLGGKLIVETLEMIENGTISREKQGEDYTLAPMITKEVCKINWNDSATNIRNLIRGLNPIPGAYTYIDDQILKIWKAELVHTKIKGEPGQVVVSNTKEGLIVSTGNGLLNITELQMPNSRRMNTLDYLRGNEIKINTILM